MFQSAQTAAEFRTRTDAASASDYAFAFNTVQTMQGLFCVTSQIGYLLLVKRHAALHNRSFYLMAASAVTDLMFGIYILLFVGVLPLCTADAVLGGQSACQVFGIWSTITLLLSMSILTIMAYDRYRSVCTPLDPLTDDDVIRLGKVAMGLVTTLNISFAASGGSAVQPSGTYCELPTCMDEKKNASSTHLWLCFLSVLYDRQPRLSRSRTRRIVSNFATHKRTGEV